MDETSRSHEAEPGAGRILARTFMALVAVLRWAMVALLVIAAAHSLRSGDGISAACLLLTALVVKP